MRGVLRWLRRLLLGVIALAVLVIAAGLFTAHTAWGRAWLRERVEHALRDVFPGGARIAAVEGSVLGTLVIRGVAIDGPDGAPVIAVGELRAAIALWPLLVNTARIDDVVADDVRVFVRDGAFASPAGPAPEPDAPVHPGASSAWRVELPAVSIQRARVEITAGGAVHTLADTSVRGALSVERGRVEIAGWVHSRWQERAARLTAWVAVVLDGTVAVPVALGALRDDRAAVAYFAAHDAMIKDGEPSGRVAISTTGGALAALVPELGARDRLAALGEVAVIALAHGARELPRAAWTPVELRARAGAATAWASLQVDLVAGAARGVVSASADQLAALTDGRVCGAGHVTAALDGDVHKLRGTVIVRGGIVAMIGRIAQRAPSVAACGAEAGGEQIDEAIIAVDATREQAIVHLLGASAGLHGFATARVRRTGDGAIALEDARAATRLAVVSGQRMNGAIIAGDTRITGELAVDARASGPVWPSPALTVRGVLTGRGVAVADIAIADARAEVDVRLAGAAPRIDARVAASGIRKAGSDFGALAAEIATASDGSYALSVTARPARDIEAMIAGRARVGGDGEVSLAIERTRVALPTGAVWAGGGGRLTVSDAAIALRDTVLRHGDATLALAAGVDRARGAITARARAERFGLASLDAGFRGLASGTLDLAYRGGQWTAGGEVTAHGVAFAPGAPAIGGTIRLALAKQRAELDAQVAGPALGSASVAVELTAPRDPFDVAAWRAIEVTAIHRAAVAARGVVLAGVVALGGGGKPSVVRGTIDGDVDLAPAALRGTLALRGGSIGAAGVEGELTLAPRDGGLAAALASRWTSPSSRTAGATVAAQLALPHRPFDPASWSRDGRELLQSARVDVASVAFDPELFAELGATRALTAALPYRGRARVALDVGRALDTARIAIDLDGVTGGALVAPVSTQLALDVDGSATRARLAIQSHDAEDHGFGLGVLEAELAMTTDGWLSAPAAALEAPLTARWTLAAAQAPPVLALLGRRDLLGGTLEGNATVHGTLARPILDEARLVARDLALAPRLGGKSPAVFRVLAIEAAWDGARGRLALSGSQSTGGELRAVVTGEPDRLTNLVGSLTTQRLDIAPLAVLLPSVIRSMPGALGSTSGVLDADLTLRSGGLFAGTLHLTGGALPISAEVGTLRDAALDIAVRGPATPDGAGTIEAKLAGALGRGTMRLTAHAPIDLSAITARLALVNVSPITALRPNITADLRAQLHVRDRRLGGDITVDTATITLPDHTDTALLDPSAPSDIVFVGAPVAPPADSPLRADASSTASGSAVPPPYAPSQPWFAANIALRQVRMLGHDVAEGIGFDASLHADQLALAVGDRVAITGRIELDNAYVDVLGRRYNVEPSNIEFDGSTDPWLHVRMTHVFPDLTLLVVLDGRSSKLDPRFSSEPGGYSHDQLFGFFLGGEPGGDPSSQTREAVTGAGARLISGKLGRQISKVLPIKLDSVSCEPATTATAATGGSCTFGKWISQRLFLAYRQRLGGGPDENTGDVQVQYRMGRKVLIEGAGGDRGHYGADLLFRHRW